jgi:hypothetical protein
MAHFIRNEDAVSDPGFDILLYPGQSNTVGIGTGAYIDPSSSVNDYRIWQVGLFAPNNKILIPMAQPLNFPGNAGSVTIGYGISLARYYAARYLKRDRQLVIVPAAKSGTSILQWLNVISSTLYADMAASISVCQNLTGTNRIVGWFECQGEADINTANDDMDPDHALMPDAATYLTRKLQYIDLVRADYGAAFPMFFGLFTDGLLLGNRPLVLEFEQAIQDAADQRSLCYTVSGAGLDYVSLHYSAQGQQDLAVRLFDAYVSYRQNNS